MSKTPFPIPHIQLLCIDEAFAAAFEVARTKHKLRSSSVSISHHSERLHRLPATVKFDTIVSPANSYARLDGAFDDAISRAFSPLSPSPSTTTGSSGSTLFTTDDYLALTHVAQRAIYEKYRGFAPPGSCTLVRIPREFDERNDNVWGCRRVALCPTMRSPTNVNWDREVVYECVWSLLCEVDNHNKRVRSRQARNIQSGSASGGQVTSKPGDGDGDDDEEIKSILMTPLATGVGRVSAQRWASQTVLALKHYLQACENPDKWSRLDWADFGVSVVEVQQTWDL